VRHVEEKLGSELVGSISLLPHWVPAGAQAAGMQAAVGTAAPVAEVTTHAVLPGMQLDSM
jgi:hypothetical protein